MRTPRSIARIQLPPVLPLTEIKAFGVMFKLKAVESSNILAVGYEEASQILIVHFKGGSVYAYQHVKPSRYADLLAAKSKGSFLQQHLVGKQAHPYERLR